MVVDGVRGAFGNLSWYWLQHGPTSYMLKRRLGCERCKRSIRKLQSVLDIMIFRFHCLIAISRLLYWLIKRMHKMKRSPLVSIDQTVAAPHHTSRPSNGVSITAANHYYRLITNSTPTPPLLLSTIYLLENRNRMLLVWFVTRRPRFLE